MIQRFIAAVMTANLRKFAANRPNNFRKYAANKQCNLRKKAVNKTGKTQKTPLLDMRVPRQMNEVNLTRRGGGINGKNSENIVDFHLSGFDGYAYLHACKRITTEAISCFFEKN